MTFLFLFLPLASIASIFPPSLPSSSSEVEFSCPRTCFCNVFSRIVYCSRRGLLSIPPGISSTSLQLNLNANVFQHSSLSRSNFTGLDDLGHLYMSECGIEDIQMGTFEELKSLKWLDLSNNRLKILREFVFEGLSLQHLFLNGNRHLTLLPGSFEGLLTTGLYLHDCSLSELVPSVLNPLNSTLRYLWLNGNELTGLDAEIKPLLHTLIHLRLGSNPLHCNCELIWLKEFFDGNIDVFKGAVAPSCLTPSRLKGKLFDQVTGFEFSCRVPSFTDIEVAFGLFGARLKCTASGDPMPTLYWIQPSGKATKYSSALDEDLGRNEGVLAMNGVRDLESLRGMYICIAHNDAGNVTLTINVSWTDTRSGELPKRFLIGKSFHHNPTMTTSRPPDDDPSSPRRHLVLLQHSTDPPEIQSLPSGVPHRERSRGLDDQTPLHRVPLDSGSEQEQLFDSNGQRLFTTLELAGAVLGTHLGTMVLCLVLISKIYRCRVKPNPDEVEKMAPVPGFSDEDRGKLDHLPPTTAPVQAVFVGSSCGQTKHFIVTDYSKVKLNNSPIQ